MGHRVSDFPLSSAPCRSPKIDGLDYYEFCELIRSSSM